MYLILKLKKSILALLFMFLMSNAFGQQIKLSNQIFESESVKSANYSIYYNEKFPKDALKNMGRENLSVLIFNSQNELVEQLDVNSLSDFYFTIPGIYLIELKSDHSGNTSHEECHHPEHYKIEKIEVLPYRFSFDFDNISFSNAMKGNVEMANATLSLPLKVETYSGNSLNVEGLKFTTAGVNTTLEGTLRTEHAILSPGVHLVSYQLKGMVSPDTYIMFDFGDLNGQNQTYYYPTKIN
jgi:hypothetical protein